MRRKSAEPPKVNASTAPSPATRSEERRSAKRAFLSAKQRAKKAKQQDVQRAKALKNANRSKSTTRQIGFRKMYEDGICEIEPTLFSKSLEFSDINYQNSRRDEQEHTFISYCELLNYCRPDMSLQITINNRSIDAQAFKSSMLLKSYPDSLDEYRHEMNDMLIGKALEGQNSMIREKYATFATHAEDYVQAKSVLSRMETDFVNQFKSVECDVSPLSGLQRLRVINSLTQPDKPLDITYDDIMLSGLSARSFIAPSGFDFSPTRSFGFGEYIGQTLYFGRYLPQDLSDKVLADLTDLPINLVITLHIQATDQSKSLEMVNNRIALMDMDAANKIQRSQQQGIYNETLAVPEHLRASRRAAEELLTDLKERNQRLFYVTPIIYTYAKTPEELEDQVFQIKSILKKSLIEADNIDFAQAEAFNSTLPIGKNFFGQERQRQLTTASTAIFVPFTTQELFQPGGVYYGLNASSRNLIFFDRRTLRTSSGLILGTPGSGKSFGAKREMISVLLSDPMSEVIIIDPEREYAPLAHGFDGEIIDISAASQNFINPMDISENYGDGESPLYIKSEFILSICELLISPRTGLDGRERSLLDRAVRESYATYFANPQKTPIPTLTDFYEKLKSFPEQEAQSLALSLEVYIIGSLSVFSHRTNVNTNKRLVIYDTKDLGSQLKPLAMLIVLDQIWSRITENRERGIRTWFYIDEFQLLLTSEDTRRYFFEVWSRARKWGAVPTGITQNVETLLSSEETRKIFSNSDFYLLFNQATNDRLPLAKQLNISDKQLKYLTNAPAGQGLLFAGKAIVPFVDQFPQESKLYKMMTTKIDEVAGKRQGA